MVRMSDELRRLRRHHGLFKAFDISGALRTPVAISPPASGSGSAPRSSPESTSPPGRPPPTGPSWSEAPHGTSSTSLTGFMMRRKR